jgi:hypothetical protein
MYVPPQSQKISVPNLFQMLFGHFSNWVQRAVCLVAGSKLV